MEVITEREKQILETFARIIPELSESDKSYLIGLGEGMAMRAGREPGRRLKGGEKAVDGMAV